MHPTLYVQKTVFGEIPYNTWGLMITMAFLVGSVVAHGRAARMGIDPDRMVGMYVVAIVFGLSGARLLHFLMATPDEFRKDPMIFFRIWQGGFAFYGGFILAGIAGIVYAIVRGINPWKIADLTSPSVMLGLAFGRVGCFSAGCCHGKTVELPTDAHALFPASFGGGQLWVFGHWPFLVEMTRHGVGTNNVTLYPTQIWEFGAALVIFALASWVWRHRRFDGQVIGVVLVLYALWRPVNESMRGDDIRGIDWYGLTTSQLVSIPMGVLGLVILLLRFRSGVAPEVRFENEVEPDSASAPRL